MGMNGTNGAPPDPPAGSPNDAVPAAAPAAAEGAEVPTRDVGAVHVGTWAERRLPDVTGRRDAGFQVVIRQSVLNEIHLHGESFPDIEVCGVLVGDVYRDRDNGAPFLYVESCIRGNYATGKAAQVTFTAETWNHIQDVMERRHPERRILGWYHTHPGFGVFLSDMDLFIQNNFFNEPWQIAFVYDPKSGEEGSFVWRGGKATREAFLVEEDKLDDRELPSAKSKGPAARKNNPAKAAPPSGMGNGASGMAPAGMAPGTLNDLSGRIQALEQRQRWMLAGLGLLAVVAILWPLLMFMFLPSITGGGPLFPAGSGPGANGPRAPAGASAAADAGR